MRTRIALLLAITALTARAAEKPNIVVILADDMGYSDIGCYGSEIPTPNLDALAAGGVKFSQFYNSARCCPTRASLLTGLPPHQVGIGHMTEEPNEKFRADRPPAYQGFLNNNCATLAEVFKIGGYTTLMTGKWHLGQKTKELWPKQRGFDHFYGILSGATNYFSPGGTRGITNENEPVESPVSTTDRPYYTTDAFTDHAIKFIGAADPTKPFFLYLAYNAPHWPLQAPEETIAKYRGKYKIGWDALRKQRYEKQLKMGLLDPQCELSPRDPEVPSWDSLPAEKQDEMDLRMSIYAAMVDKLDENVGKLVSYLKQHGKFDNTLILFLSDNGACAEMGVLGNNDVRNLEKRNSAWNTSYGMAWANASNTPFRQYKHFAHEGGTATPFIASWPAGIAMRDAVVNAPGQIIDIAPTLYDIAGVAYPADQPALPGVSLKPAFESGKLERTRPMFMEHEANAFVRDGDWKLVGRNVAPPAGLQPRRWQLYNLAKDRSELHNLAAENPTKVDAMSKQWDAWSKAAQVYPKQPPAAR